MSDPTQPDPSEPDASDAASEGSDASAADAAPETRRIVAPRKLQRGTVLAGRFRVGDEAAQPEGARIYEGYDIALADRRVLLVVLASDDRDRIARRWLASDNPWTAPLLDVVALEGRVVGVFDLDADATQLDTVGGASREQRASLLVDVARVLELCAAAESATQVCGEGLLWVEGLPTDARLRAVPLPSSLPDVEVRSNDLAIFARLVSAQLFGIDPVTAPSRAVEALPDGIANVVGPLYADVPHERLEAGISAAALAAALSLGPGASRVPVPLAPAAPANLASRLATAAGRVREKTRREVAAASVLLLVLMAAFYGLTSTNDRVVDEVAPVYQPVPTPIHGDAPRTEIPEPPAVTFPPEENLWPVGYATFYEGLDEDGPAPRGVGELAGADEVPNWLPHVRVYEDEKGRVERVEHFDAGRLFTGYTVYTWQENDRLAEQTRYSSTGDLMSRRRYDWDAGVIDGRLRSGEPEFAGCASVRFELDAAGRYSELHCFGRTDRPARFAEGHHTERITYDAAGRHDARTRTVRYLDASSRPMMVRGGYRALREARNGSGRLAQISFLGAEDLLVTDATTGAARVVYEYAARASKTRLFGTEGPVLGASGWHESVAYHAAGGGPSSTVTYGLQGEEVAAAGTQISRIEYELDSRQRIAAESWFSPGGGRARDGSNVHRIEYIRDAHDNILRECHFGPEGPVRSPALDGVHCIVYVHNVYGWVTGESYYDVDGSPMQDSRTRVERVHVERDQQRRVYERRYYDSDWNRALSWSGYHGVRFFYDDWGDVIRFEYIGENGGFADPAHGVVQLDITRDELGRETRRCFFDDAHERVVLADGFGQNASCFVTEYEGDRVHEIRYVGAEDEPVLALFDESRPAAIIRFHYAPDGRLLRQEFIGTDGRSVLEERTCTLAETCIATTGWSWHIP